MVPATNVYDVGDVVRCKGEFTNTETKQLGDPSALTCIVTKPDGTTITYTYNVDAALVRDSTGKYHADVEATAAGTWYYRFAGTGNNQAAGKSSFFVKS